VGLLLDNITFWDVVWWMIIMFFWVMAIWLFIAVFSDIFRRRDIGGWGKAGWIFVIFVLPFLGILIYMITRPKPTEEEMREMQAAYGGYPSTGPHTSTDDIAKAHALLQQGALTQAEYDQIKARALGN
jgi:hypothetical protein